MRVEITGVEIGDGIVKDLFLNGIRLPDACFDPCEVVLPKIMSENGGNPQTGNYLFFDFGHIHTTHTYLYAGKAVRLRNRIRSHLSTKQSWINNYWDLCWGDDWETFTGVGLFVFVWFEKDAIAFEPTLIERLHPIFNIRRP